MDRTTTGITCFDQLLEGGFESDTITTMYGPSGAAKTNICLQFAVSTALTGKKVIFVDTEGGISIDRLKQLTDNWETVLDKLLIFKPTTFEEQERTINQVKELVSSMKPDKIGGIIIDTISMLYRLERHNGEVHDTNRALGLQIAKLSEIARKKNIPILITNQVYADFDKPLSVNMVGGDLLKYGSKCLIELQKTPTDSRRAILKKHRSIKEGKTILFTIENKGIVEAKEKRFSIF